MLSPPKCISHILYFPRFARVEGENGGKGKKEKGEQDVGTPFPHRILSRSMKKE